MTTVEHRTVPTSWHRSPSSSLYLISMARLILWRIKFTQIRRISFGIISQIEEEVVIDIEFKSDSCCSSRFRTMRSARWRSSQYSSWSDSISWRGESPCQIRGSYKGMTASGLSRSSSGCASISQNWNGRCLFASRKPLLRVLSKPQDISFLRRIRSTLRVDRMYLFRWKNRAERGNEAFPFRKRDDAPALLRDIRSDQLTSSRLSVISVARAAQVRPEGTRRGACTCACVGVRLTHAAHAACRRGGRGDSGCGGWKEARHSRVVRSRVPIEAGSGERRVLIPPSSLVGLFSPRVARGFEGEKGKTVAHGRRRRRPGQQPRVRSRSTLGVNHRIN